MEFRIDNLGGGQIKELIFSKPSGFECYSKNVIPGEQNEVVPLRVEDSTIVKCYLINQGLSAPAGTAYPMKVSLKFTYEYKIHTNEIKVIGKT
ncbi:hypothetical protein HYT58_03190 [Candidatus Woesearchaeota archaeon]|nr:hypothetical protein [Candidatus Woesearchaeota archaeon]